jgi:hypothetical protein
VKLHLLAFGKLKTPGLQDSSEYYRKLLRGFVPTEETELKPLAVPDKSPATRKQIQEKEALLLEDKLKHTLSPPSRRRRKSAYDLRMVRVDSNLGVEQHTGDRALPRQQLGLFRFNASQGKGDPELRPPNSSA